MKLKNIFTWRVYLLILLLLLSIIAINPSFNNEGIVIKSVIANSSANSVGIKDPGNVQPRELEIITQINNFKIENLESYAKAVNSIEFNSPVRITTDKREYDPFLKTSNDFGLIVDKVASSNIRKGLDLEGGTRVLLQPKGFVSDQDIENAKDSISNRLNVYGLSDIKVKSANDLSGNKYIVVEVAGATKEDVKELVASQGKFEAKIGNETVFIGGERDITFVCRNDGTCSGVSNCVQTDTGYNCRFEFVIHLSPEAAKRQAQVTKNLDVNSSSDGLYLGKSLDLYLDDRKVDSLLISSDLKGKEAPQILISGPGFGIDRDEALQDALKNMNKLQTVMITGSLPFSLEIAKIDSISPSLGNVFLKNAILAGLGAIITVSLIVFIRYRKLKITIPILIAMLSELIILLGVAAVTKYSLDLAAIAGMIAAIGTGVDDQIVITDEILSSRRQESGYDLKSKIKRAFFVIMSAYALTVVAMLPLLRAGAGLLTGFAITTIVGVTIGVLITRPAFANMVRGLLEE